MANDNTQLSDGDIAGFGYIKDYTEIDSLAYNGTLALTSSLSNYYLNSNPFTFINNSVLTDNSMADTLHRHSELSASDGTPDRALVVNSIGRVGIGTASPSEKLNIYAGNLLLNGTGAGHIYLGHSVRATNRAELMLLANGADTPSEIQFGYNERVDGNVRWAISDRGNSSGMLTFYEGPSLTGGSFIERMVILKGGNVGIGTTSPGNLLELYSAGNDIDTGGVIKIVGNSAGDATEWAVKDTCTRLQHVENAADAVGGHGLIQFKTNAASTPSTPTRGGFKFTGASDFMVITNTGNVGIGTTAPVGELNVIGDGNFTGNLYVNENEVLTSESDPIFVAWDNFTGIPTATPSDGDTTHASTADQIYDFVIGLGYATTSWVTTQLADYSTTTESNLLYYGINNGFGFYNSTAFIITDYYLNTNPYSFYNSTSIPSYIETEVDPLWSGNQSSYSTKTVADTLYADISVVSNPFDQELNKTSNVEFNNITVADCIIFSNGASLCGV